jgi:ADP-heptose:LPS heptosyltransferase
MGPPENSYQPIYLETASHIGIIEMGSLRNVLQATTVSRQIRKQNETANIKWFTNSDGAKLLEYVPNVQAIDTETTDLEDNIAAIRGLGVVVNFNQTRQARELLARAKCVGGFVLNKQGKFSALPDYHPDLQRSMTDPTFKRTSRDTNPALMIRNLGLKARGLDYDLTLYSDSTEEADEVLERSFDKSFPHEIIGLNIGVGSSERLHQWGPKSFARLAIRLASANVHTGIAILSGPKDQEALDTFKSELNRQSRKYSIRTPNIKRMPNNLDIGTFMGLIDRMDRIVSADTFALHVAKALGVPTVALFGPTSHRSAPNNEADRPISAGKSCNPCQSDCNVRQVSDCMTDIPVGAVLRQLREQQAVLMTV